MKRTPKSKKPTSRKSAFVPGFIEALKPPVGTLDLTGSILTVLPEFAGWSNELRSLDLSHNRLKALPNSVDRLTKLHGLPLGFNELAALLESIALLTGLKELDLSFNQLVELPESIGQLTQLQTLNLSSDELKELPESIGRLTQLQWLDLSDNELEALPESIGQLAQLQRLDLFYNQLTALPEFIGRLSQLQILHLSDNRLTALPESIGRLTKLQHLRLWRNQIKALPESIGRLTKLEHLNLSDNQLTQLPESIGRLTKLERLNLTDNQLTQLPESLRELDSLKEIYLHGNEKLALPPEVLGPSYKEVLEHPRGVPPAEPRKILDYYFRVRKDRRPLNEAKLILIGRGAAGKTCTVNRLVHNRFDRDEKKTEGIRITEWPLELNGNENVRLNIWDFGGQEIMHATHQFFLTQRSLYLLVLNGREGGEDADAEYWLRLIESFGGDSPVIIVLNRIKEHPFDLNRRGLQQKFPAIRDFIETDCEDGTGREKLLKAIRRETDRLEHLRDFFPASWFSIKDRLTGMKENYLSFDEYRNICAKLGEDNSEAQEALAFYLHSLGIALNYRDDARLQDMHVLNPHWVTKGIYTILNSEILAKQQGEIRLNDVSGILKSDEYPLKMHRFLLDLMKKFDLCFSFPHNDAHYLIPELLDKQEPEASAEFRPKNCLNFQYHYPVLPEGLLARFIVRSHQLSEGQPRWRTGVILEFEDNRALVKADVQDRKVFISVAGPTQSQLLAIIRSDFERIHANIRNLNPVAMVPLPNYPNVVVPYRELLVMERNGITSFTKVIGDEVIEIEVGALLNGIDVDRGFRSREELHRFDTIPFENSRDAEFPSAAGSETSININIGGRHMAKYKVGQAGAVGAGAHAHDITFNQIWNEMKGSVDLPRLAAELTALREQMKKDALTVEHDAAVGDISKAEQAAKAGDGAKAIEYLKSAGRWAFDNATKIGTTLAAEVLKKSLLNP